MTEATLRLRLHRFVFNSLQLFSLLLVVAEKVSILAGVNVLVNLQQEPLAEFERLKESLFRDHVQ